MNGTVILFNEDKGYGFIVGEDNEKYFVHRTGLRKESVRADEAVAFDIVEGDKGPKADNVRELDRPEEGEIEGEELEEETPQVDVITLIRDTATKRLIKAIVADPDMLDRLEWRELERLIAEAFGGLGFSVKLTPPSKDGGKDVILQARVRGEEKTYYVEVKHWKHKRVGEGMISDFFDVIVQDNIHGGLLLSTSGYSVGVRLARTEVERTRLRLGTREKVVGLCRCYEKSAAGVWSPPDLVQGVLYDGTL